MQWWRCKVTIFMPVEPLMMLHIRVGISLGVRKDFEMIGPWYFSPKKSCSTPPLSILLERVAYVGDLWRSWHPLCNYNYCWGKNQCLQGSNHTWCSSTMRKFTQSSQSLSFCIFFYLQAGWSHSENAHSKWRALLVKISDLVKCWIYRPHSIFLAGHVLFESSMKRTKLHLGNICLRSLQAN